MNTVNKNVMEMPRKPYAKPRIAIEEFTHNQFIANCQVSVNGNWRQELQEVSPLDYLAVMRGQLFVTELNCINHADGDFGTPNVDTLCYHTSSSPLFGS
jgi:hypothetical protein